MEQVKYDTTPKAERTQYFDSPQDTEAPELPTHYPLQPTTTVGSDKHSMSFKHFILEGGPQTPGDEIDIEGNMRQMRLEKNTDGFEEPRTPTQQAFTTA